MNEETIFNVSPYGGRTFRLLVCDCHNTPILSEAISRILYTVFRESLGKRTPVEGHEEVEVEKVGAFFDELQTSVHTNEKYNFEHRISAKMKPPFPQYNGRYVVVYTFYDLQNEPHPCVITCLSQ